MKRRAGKYRSGIDRVARQVEGVQAGMHRNRRFLEALDTYTKMDLYEHVHLKNSRMQKASKD